MLLVLDRCTKLEIVLLTLDRSVLNLLHDRLQLELESSLTIVEALRSIASLYLRVLGLSEALICRLAPLDKHLVEV